MVVGAKVRCAYWNKPLCDEESTMSLNHREKNHGVNMLGTDNFAIGSRALFNLTSGSFNIVLGKNSGTAITCQSCNFIFGDDIPGFEKDNQFLIADAMPTLTEDQALEYLKHYEDICARLCDPHFITKHTKEELKIMQDCLFALKIKCKSIHK